LTAFLRFCAMLESVWQDFIEVGSSKRGDLLSSINIALSISKQTLDNGRVYADRGVTELMNDPTSLDVRPIWRLHSMDDSFESRIVD
jgi:hypothetical protein